MALACLQTHLKKTNEHIILKNSPFFLQHTRFEKRTI